MSIPTFVYGQNGVPSKEIVASVLSRRDAGTQILPRSVNTGWYNEAVAKIEEREYFMAPMTASGSFGSVNHVQRLGYRFDPNGYSVNDFNADGSTKEAWSARFDLGGIGRDGHLRKARLSKVCKTGDHSLSYEYNDYTISYDNRKEGMEQSFVIRKRPAGVKALQVVIDLRGDLEAVMGEGDQLVLHTAGRSADVRLVYDQFKVWDKDGKALPAHMRLDGAGRLVLSVDDRHAAYPITIDPLNHTPSLVMTLTGVLGTTVNELTSTVLGGYSLSAAGDVNGDGTDDLIIGAPLFTTISVSGGSGTLSGVARGAAFVYYGVANGVPLTTPSQVLQPPTLTDGSLFGFSVSTAGDLDGDGKADLVIGAPGTTISVIGIFPQPPIITVACGAVYVFKGSAMTADVNVKPGPSATVTLSSAEIAALSTNPLYGFSVSNAGDITNDGRPDIIVGCPGWSLGTGRADIYYGANNANGLLSLAPSKTITGVLPASLFGFSVSGAGNVNSDNFADVVVGSPGVLPTILQGQAYVFHGSAAGIVPSFANGASGVNGTTLSGTGTLLSGTLYGFSVSRAGDVNGDGHDDVIVGEPLHLEGTIAASGRAYIYYGSAAATGIAGSVTILRSPRSPAILGTGIPLNLLFGFSVGNAGNVVGDAAGDVLVGEPGSAVIANTTLLSGTLASLGITLNTSTRVLSGAVYLYNGHVGSPIATNQAPYWSLTNSDVVTAADLLGASVHYAGDVNDDGFDDFLVGSPSGGIDLGVNLSNRATNVSLSIGNGLFNTANGSAGNYFLFFGFSAALPVSLLDFTGRLDQSGVILDWSTAQEQNSDRFEIERSADNGTFTSIGQVAAAHNSTQLSSYTFTDAAPLQGVGYYRLKMVDLDGKFTYSKVVVVNAGASIRALTVYPNPAQGSFQLKFSNMPAGRYDMSLINSIGQTMLTKRIQVASATSYNETVNLAPHMSGGTYMIKVVDQQQHTFITRIVVR